MPPARTSTTSRSSSCPSPSTAARTAWPPAAAGCTCASASSAATSAAATTRPTSTRPPMRGRRAPDHPLARAGRGLVVVLRGRGRDADPRGQGRDADPAVAADVGGAGPRGQRAGPTRTVRLIASGVAPSGSVSSTRAATRWRVRSAKRAADERSSFARCTGHQPKCSWRKSWRTTWRAGDGRVTFARDRRRRRARRARSSRCGGRARAAAPAGSRRRPATAR